MKTKRPKTEMDYCQYYYSDLTMATLPDNRLALPLRRHWWNLKRYAWYARVLGLPRFIPRMLRLARSYRRASERKPSIAPGDVTGKRSDLEPGKWVEVSSEKEIFDTLDSQGKLKGLRFTPEMGKFCGKRFKVYKRLDKILLETTGELRKIRTPTVILEGVFCDGSSHGGCDRSCFCFWREAWIKRVDATNTKH